MFLRTNGARAFKTQKLGKRDPFIKMPLESKNEENTPASKMQSQSGILEFWLRQPSYLGIRYLNINFGAILTLNEKWYYSHKLRK